MLKEKYLIEKKVLLVGASTSHIVFLKKWGMSPVAGVDLVLVESAKKVPYTGVLSGYLAAKYNKDQITIDLVQLTRFAGARLINDQVKSIDPLKKSVTLYNSPAMNYDILALATGLKAKGYPASPKALVYHLYPAAKIYYGFEDIKNTLKTNDTLKTISLIGYNQTTFEVALCLNKGLRQSNAEFSGLKLQIISAGRKFVGNQPPKLQQKMLALLAASRIALLETPPITAIDERKIDCQQNMNIASDLNIICESVPNTVVHDNTTDDPLAGNILTNHYLQATAWDNIFASGSIAKIPDVKEPNSGVKSVNQGKILASNIKACLTAKKMKKYRPTLKPLAIINTADNRGLLIKHSYHFHNRWCLRLKYFIDNRYLKSTRKLKPPLLKAPFLINRRLTKTISSKMLNELNTPVCYGCAAKVTKNDLSQVLSKLELENNYNDNVVWGLKTGEDASVFKLKNDTSEAEVVQTTDFLQSFTDNHYLFAKIATLHALNDILAKGISGGFAHSLVILPYEARLFHQEYLQQIIAGSLEVLTEHKVQLIGGHSAEGPLLGKGLSLSATAKSEKLWRKDAIDHKDSLILTKAIGSGILLKGMMLNLIDAETALELELSQLKSNQLALAIFRKYGVKAATDISGFGLINHLDDMLDKSGKQARLYLNQVPILKGARQLASLKLTTSLTSRNQEATIFSTDLKNDDTRLEDAKNLLYDPQTSGGLLVAVAAENAASCLAELHASGYQQAAVIGEALAEDEESHLRISLV